MEKVINMTRYRGGQEPRLGDRVLCNDFAMAVTVIEVGPVGGAVCTTSTGQTYPGTAIRVQDPRISFLEDGPCFPAGKLILIERGL